MVLFPNCKINLGLNIVRKRTDGYHDLETVFYPVNLCDVLEVVNTADHSSNKPVTLTTSGIAMNTEPNENICVKAYHLLKKDFPDLPSVEIYLHKVIPTGAGLGGGSSDAAFTLRILNEKFHLGLSTAQLINYALQLGSDCPFFVINKPCFAAGRGEVLEEIKVDLLGYKIVLVNPGIHISTSQAFDQLTPAMPEKSIKENIKQPVRYWRDLLTNDFEKNIFIQYPEIKKIKETFYNAGAMYASLSGSGSTVFALFEKDIPGNLKFPESFLQVNIQL